MSAEPYAPTPEMVRCKKCRRTGLYTSREDCWRCQGTGWMDPGVLPTLPRHGPGTFAGLGDLFDRGGRTKIVAPWRPIDEPVSLDGYRTRTALEKAQRTLHTAIAAAAEPLPCRQPGPDLWLSEDRTERQKGAALCSSCPVLAECGALAAAAPLDTWGVFGGHDYGNDADALAELRAVSAAVFGGSRGAQARKRRDELLRELRGSGVSAATLAEAAGVTTSAVYMAVRGRAQGARSKDRRRAKAATDGASKARRRPQHEAEVAAYADDPRVRRLRSIALPPGRYLRDPVLRAERAELVGSLWAADPQFWTNERLAVVIGVSSPACAGRILREARRAREA